MPKQLAEDFKIKCKADNISMASIVKKAIEESETMVKIGLINADKKQRELAFAFQRSFDNIDEESTNRLLEILEKFRRQ